MKADQSIPMIMDSAVGKETADQTTKRLFSRKDILCNILKYTVSEYKDCSLDEIMDCIEGDTLQTGTALLSEDMARTIRGEHTEMNSLDEAGATFDILFRSLLPGQKGSLKINLHIDFEIQGDYSPGYPIVKRGIYYTSRQLSSQLPKVGKNGIGYKGLEKVYSIWVCLKNVPKELQNTISYYKIKNYKNEGIADDVKVDVDACDLIEVIIIRLDGEEVTNKGLLDLLYGVFSGNRQKVIEYLPPSIPSDQQKEVDHMLNIISYAEEKGVEKGRVEGENKLSRLIQKLLANNQNDRVATVVSDEKERQRAYQEYDIH